MREVAMDTDFMALQWDSETGFGHAVLGIAASKMTQEEATKIPFAFTVLGRWEYRIGLLV